MSKEEKLVSTFAKLAVSIGMKPPSYPKPRWYQFGLKQKLRRYDELGWPYTLEARK